MKPAVLDNGTMTGPVLKTRNCRWIAVPGASDSRGQVNFLELGKGLDFAPRRLFWLHHIAAGQWRGRHGHRQTELVLVAMHGGCQVHLDDGERRQTVGLDDPAWALYVGTWVWHELTDFAPQSAVLAIASTLYDEAEYLRDYEVFKREAAARP
jgi:WxcM-like, C-terminal